MKRITEKSIIGKVIIQYPKTSRIFVKYGFGCIHCPLASSESIERGALAHGLDVVKLKALLAELNKAAEVSKKLKAKK